MACLTLSLDTYYSFIYHTYYYSFLLTYPLSVPSRAALSRWYHKAILITNQWLFVLLFSFGILSNLCAPFQQRPRTLIEHRTVIYASLNTPGWSHNNLFLSFLEH